jgi:hypothetical protein
MRERCTPVDGLLGSVKEKTNWYVVCFAIGINPICFKLKKTKNKLVSSHISGCQCKESL